MTRQTKWSICPAKTRSDQPGNLPSLIRAFAFHLKKPWVIRPQSDQSLCCPPEEALGSWLSLEWRLIRQGRCTQVTLLVLLCSGSNWIIWAATWLNWQSSCAPSQDSDQPGHPPSVIRVFAVHMKKAWVLSYQLSAQWRLWSDWADAQADLSLCWAHTLFFWFCHVVAQIFSFRIFWFPNCVVLSVRCRPHSSHTTKFTRVWDSYTLYSKARLYIPQLWKLMTLAHDKFCDSWQDLWQFLWQATKNTLHVCDIP